MQLGVGGGGSQNSSRCRTMLQLGGSNCEVGVVDEAPKKFLALAPKDHHEAPFSSINMRHLKWKRHAKS